ncbi:MAG: cytochrome c oxidase subunit 3 [Microthrixaceae bacterium]|nr:cytochrome c oxidase subunit 3 [Microthrixaceae bacterium]MCO5311689.1 cytochrome c oxidase subunit 3 [Microthrixaceae bacterium]
MSIIPAEIPAAVLPRRRQLLFGTVFVSIAVAMYQLALVGLYLQERSARSNVWFAEHTIPLTQPNMQLSALGLSVVFVQWAVWAIARNQRGQAYFALGCTLLMGFAFLNQTTFLWTEIGLPMTNVEGPLFYAVTASHFAIIVAAMVFLLVTAFRTLAGSNSAEHPEGVSAAALFWHVSVALYTVVWLAVYIMK